MCMLTVLRESTDKLSIHCLTQPLESCKNISALTEKSLKRNLVDIGRYNVPSVTEEAQEIPNSFFLFLICED